jgi:hypothetical protein
MFGPGTQDFNLSGGLLAGQISQEEYHRVYGYDSVIGVWRSRRPDACANWQQHNGTSSPLTDGKNHRFKGKHCNGCAKDGQGIKKQGDLRRPVLRSIGRLSKAPLSSQVICEAIRSIINRLSPQPNHSYQPKYRKRITHCQMGRQKKSLFFSTMMLISALN